MDELLRRCSCNKGVQEHKLKALEELSKSQKELEIIAALLQNCHAAMPHVCGAS